MDRGMYLKELIKKKHTNVRELAKNAGIPATTLYSIIDRGSGIRYDTAIALGNVLGVPPETLCDRKFLSIKTESFKGKLIDMGIVSRVEL